MRRDDLKKKDGHWKAVGYKRQMNRLAGPAVNKDALGWTVVCLNERCIALRWTAVSVRKGCKVKNYWTVVCSERRMHRDGQFMFFRRRRGLKTDCSRRFLQSLYQRAEVSKLILKVLRK